MSLDWKVWNCEQKSYLFFSFLLPYVLSHWWKKTGEGNWTLHIFRGCSCQGSWTRDSYVFGTLKEEYCWLFKWDSTWVECKIKTISWSSDRNDGSIGIELVIIHFIVSQELIYIFPCPETLWDIRVKLIINPIKIFKWVWLLWCSMDNDGFF